jgi:uncharacterized protein
MSTPTEGYCLRIYIGESDKKDGMPLHEWLVGKAKGCGIAGATVFRGTLGFGAHSHIRSAKLFDLSVDLPIVVEIVDEKEKLDAFMAIVDINVEEGLATMQKVEVHFYRARKGKSQG